MPSEFGPLFFNLALEPRGPGFDFTDALRRVCERIRASVTGNGTVWFPPGVYRIDTGWMLEPGVTLAFAPGALLIPTIPVSAGTTPESMVLRVQGAIEAELRPIFGILETAPLESLEGVRAVGRVAFVGDAVRRVFPEWWGASRDGPLTPPSLDTAAIQAAIQCAVIDRGIFDTNAHPVSVSFRGSYRVSQGIVVAPLSAASIRAAVFEGETSTSSTATFTASESATLDAILHFVRIPNITLRNLSFDGAGRSDECVRVEDAFGVDRVDHRTHVSGCHFRNAIDTSLSIVDGTTADPGRGSIQVSVTRCHFAGVERRFIRKREAQTDLLHPLGTRQVGVLCSAAFRTSVLVSACIFDGFARRGIVAEGCRLEVSECHFSIVESPEVTFAMATDVELRASDATGPGDASLDALACVSRSPTFLRVVPARRRTQGQPLKGTPAAPVVVLTCVSHLRGVIDLGTYAPPALIWEDVNPRLTSSTVDSPPGAHLTLVGCLFDLPVAVSAPPSSLDAALLPPAGLFPTARVFVTNALKRVNDVGSFHPVMARPTLTFGAVDRALVRTLGILGVSDGEAPLSIREWLDVRLDSEGRLTGRWLLALAWATWLWEPLE